MLEVLEGRWWGRGREHVQCTLKLLSRCMSPLDVGECIEKGFRRRKQHEVQVLNLEFFLKQRVGNTGRVKKRSALFLSDSHTTRLKAINRREAVKRTRCYRRIGSNRVSVYLFVHKRTYERSYRQI